MSPLGLSFLPRCYSSGYRRCYSSGYRLCIKSYRMSIVGVAYGPITASTWHLVPLIVKSPQSTLFRYLPD
jgi:hypothetical protein